MIVYIYPVILSLLSVLLYKSPKIALISSISTLTLLLSYMVGYRFDSDPDYSVYIEFIDIAKGLSFSDYVSSFYVEPFFYFSARYFGEFSFAVFAFLSLYLLLFFCFKQGCNWSLAYALIIANVFYICFYIQIRWGLALVLLLLALHYFYLRVRLLAMLFLAFSIASHLSVILFLPFFVTKLREREWYIFFLSVMLVAISYAFNVRSLDLLSILVDSLGFFPYLEYKLSAYLIAFKEVEPFFYFLYVKYLLQMLVLWVFYRDFSRVKSNWSLPFFLSLLLFALFIDVGVLAQRLSNLSDVFFCLYFIDIFSNSKASVNRWFSVLFFLIVSWVFSLTPMIYKGYLLPYHQWVF